MMHAVRTPHEAYRRVEFDARVTGADPAGLVLVCFEQLDQSLAAALNAAAAGDNQRRSTALTGALAAITALQLGIDEAYGIAASLAHFYTAARRTLLGSVLSFDPVIIAALRDDFGEVARALAEAA